MFSNPEKIISQFNIDPGHVVADIGAGTGYYSIACAKILGRTGKVYAVDIQRDLLDKLKKNSRERGISNIEIVWADVDEVRGIRIRDGIIDRVIAANILFQVEKKDNLVDEIKRILKPNGKVLIVDWKASYGGLGPQPQDVITKDAARVLFESDGFVFDKEVSAGEHHYGLIFKKS